VDFAQTTFPVSQNADSVEVQLRRSPAEGTMNVEVWTEPAGAGSRNIEPVRQTVRFDEGESVESVRIPLRRDATNTGRVDVGLRLRPLDPGVGFVSGRRVGGARTGPPARIAILDRPEVEPPRIEETWRTPQGLVLRFSEALDPARARDPRNYVVLEARTEQTFKITFPFVADRLKADRAPIRSVDYDSATQTVTIHLARALRPESTYVVQSANYAGWGRVRRNANPDQVVTDQAGNPVASDYSLAGEPTGSFRVRIRPNR
jgi:hypothetical protein